MDCLAPDNIGIVAPENADKLNSKLVKVFELFFFHAFLGGLATGV